MCFNCNSLYISCSYSYLKSKQREHFLDPVQKNLVHWGGIKYPSHGWDKEGPPHFATCSTRCSTHSHLLSPASGSIIQERPLAMAHRSHTFKSHSKCTVTRLKTQAAFFLRQILMFAVHQNGRKVFSKHRQYTNNGKDNSFSPQTSLSRVTTQYQRSQQQLSHKP